MEWNRLDVYPDDIGNFSANDLKSAQRTRMFSCWHDTKRGVDYRKSLVEVTTLMQGKLDDRFYTLFETLCQIQEIFYSYDRSPALILRLHNLTFIHAITLVDSFSKTKHGSYSANTFIPWYVIHLFNFDFSICLQPMLRMKNVYSIF